MKTTLKQSCTIKTLTCLIAGIAGISPALLKAADEEGVSKLLAEAKTQSYVVSVDAATLESFTRSNYSWQSHALEVNHMRDDINAAAKTVTALNAAKGQAAAWQVTAIGRIIPFMQEIAADTTAAIEYINKNQGRLQMKEYQDYLRENSQTSGELATLIAHFVDYGNHKSRYDSLKNTLELPGK